MEDISYKRGKKDNSSPDCISFGVTIQNEWHQAA